MVQKIKKVRKHRGIIQKGGNTGRLRKGFRYSGKKLKNGLPQIIKVTKKKKKKIINGGGNGDEKYDESYDSDDEDDMVEPDELKDDYNDEHIIKYSYDNLKNITLLVHHPRVITVIHNIPSLESKLQLGDIILKIGDIVIDKKELYDNIVNILKGNNSLTILRNISVETLSTNAALINKLRCQGVSSDLTPGITKNSWNSIPPSLKLVKRSRPLKVKRLSSRDEKDISRCKSSMFDTGTPNLGSFFNDKIFKINDYIFKAYLRDYTGMQRTVGKVEWVGIIHAGKQYKHVLLQPTTTSCVYTTAIMLILDKMANGSNNIADIGYLKTGIGSSISETTCIRSQEIIAEEFKKYIKINNIPIKLKKNLLHELINILQKYGSVGMEGTEGHQIILDDIDVKNNIAYFRDPMYGAQIITDLYTLLSLIMATTIYITTVDVNDEFKHKIYKTLK